MSDNTTRVHILYTGGTIGMAAKSIIDRELVPKPLEELLMYVPGWDAVEKTQDSLESDGIDVGNGITLTFSKMEPIDSSSITPEKWLEMAKKIEAVYNDNDGFVILHGTDTMAYTASGLAFIFENLAKPIVVTGSQLPISDTRTDAVMNLVNAVQIAAWKVTGLPCIPEVVICFADRLLRGCRSSKVSSTAWAGFDSPNYPHLGEIGEHIRVNKNLLLPIPIGKSFHLNQDLRPNIMDISLNPGMKPEHLEQIMNLPEIEAVVLRTYGAGNAPEDAKFLNTIGRIAETKTIVNITQCTQGMVEMGLYAASSGMLEKGVISGLDMTPEAALTKLYWTLGTKIKAQQAIQMQVSQRGEQSENLFDLRFGSHDRTMNTEDVFDNFVTPDRRFTSNRLTRAVIRFSGLGVTSLDKGNISIVRVFMNKPSAKSDTPLTDPRMIAQFEVFDQSTINPVREIDFNLAQSNLGDGEITLSVRADDGVKVFFDGLFLVLFAQA